MIQITENQITDSLKKGAEDYINLYTDAYLAEVDNELNADNMQKLALAIIQFLQTTLCCHQHTWQ